MVDELTKLKSWKVAELGNYPLASLFIYKGELRKFLLDFKVKKHWQSGRILTQLFRLSPEVLAWVRGADALIPVPSSLWGRWKGKPDLAYILADALSLECGIALMPPPRQLYFRLKKQAFLSQSERKNAGISTLAKLTQALFFKLRISPKNGTNSGVSQRLRYILIDDIITTGRTLESFAQNWPHAEIRLLTLARAYSEKSKGKPDDTE